MIRQLSVLLLNLGIIVTSTTAAAGEQQRLYFGTYTHGDSVSDGIYTCLMDLETGALSTPQLAVRTDDPAFLTLHPTQPLLFCVNELGDYQSKPQGAVTAFRILDDGQRLQEINQQPTGGAHPCHLSLDRTSRHLLVTNYSGGSTVVFPVSEQGQLGDASCFLQHEGTGPNTARQEMAHAHSVNLSSDNRFAYVADLGADLVRTFLFDADRGQLHEATPRGVSVSAGGGPRHFVLSADEKFAWSNNELTATVTAFRRNPQSGRLSMLQELSTVPNDHEGRLSTAECLLHPNGRTLYVSNRGHESIAVFRIDDDGHMTRLAITHTGGEEPRNFFIEPGGRWLLAANQNTDNVVVFRIADDGTLTRTEHQISVGRPVCIRMR